jgi:hypothetical protein
MPELTIDTNYFITELKSYLGLGSGAAPDGGVLKGKLVALLHTPFGLSFFGALMDLIEEAVEVLEKIVADLGEMGAGKGAEKKAALIRVLDASVNLPIMFEPFDGVVFGWLIDIIVKAVNFGR